MNINNESDLIKELERQETALRISIAEKKQKIKKIRKQLCDLRGRAGFPWTENSMKCIKEFNEMVSSDEILQSIFHNRLKELQEPDRRRGYITALSVALNKLCKNGKLISEKHKGIKGLFYGFPEWLAENGELMAYYKYTLENKKKERIK